MNRRLALLLTAALAAMGLIGLGYWFVSSNKPASPDASAFEALAIQPNGPVAAIFFPGSSGKLEPEMRPAPPELDREQRNVWLAEQLTVGPDTAGLKPALPAGTKVAGVFAAPDGTLFVDFTLSAETVGMGSTDELLVIYSVVNTLLLDNELSDRAVILLNGRQRETLAGHVDTSMPLAARPDFIRTAG